MLQDDITRLYHYCVENKLILNLSKCSKISFTRNRNVIKKDYKVLDSVLLDVAYVKDLGLILDSKMIFNLHVDAVIKKAFRMLGFIRRMTVPFQNISTVTTLYFTLVRSQLEFATTCWSPHYMLYINRIEKVQKMFLKYINFKFPNNNIKLLSLENRRKFLDIMFLFKIMNNKVDCPELLNLFSIRVPSYRTRVNELFILPFKRTTSAYNSPINRMCAEFNSICNSTFFIDIFDSSLEKFKYDVLQFLM